MDREIMTEKRTYTEELVELRLAVAPVPEIKEDLKELVRAIKGSNGDVGLVARVAQVEKSTIDQIRDYSQFKHSCELHRKETNDIISQRFDRLFDEIQAMNKERIHKLEEEEDAREAEGRTVRKDFRNFWIGLGLGLIPQLFDWIVRLF